ncbi:uncharacterized protein EAF01_007450 [Botrytis porri]|uniref:uncharacterized protein n=1 Tax=Botrytis porri TaxID=87229 RepID=UPI0019023388|nr:uncharacterized protein EAF01_007450 [Botrytis porri]KAF7902152.1 hypothetical protein EAF01_007450 [Botrytis porri]
MHNSARLTGMSSPSVQSIAPANLGTRKYCLSTVVQMSKKFLGGICLYIWKLLTVPLCKAGVSLLSTISTRKSIRSTLVDIFLQLNHIISRYHRVADAQAALDALKAQLAAQHVGLNRNGELNFRTDL